MGRSRHFRPRQKLPKVLQQGKHGLWSGIGLRKRCQGRLLQDLRFGQIGCGRRDIGIANTGFGSRIVTFRRKNEEVTSLV